LTFGDRRRHQIARRIRLRPGLSAREPPWQAGLVQQRPEFVPEAGGGQLGAQEQRDHLRLAAWPQPPHTPHLARTSVAVLLLPSCQHRAGAPGPALKQLSNHHLQEKIDWYRSQLPAALTADIRPGNS